MLKSKARPTRTARPAPASARHGGSAAAKSTARRHIKPPIKTKTTLEAIMAEAHVFEVKLIPKPSPGTSPVRGEPDRPAELRPGRTGPGEEDPDRELRRVVAGRSRLAPKPAPP